MSRDVKIKGKKLRLDPSRLIGQGGEAEVYDIREFFPELAPLALKLWKAPDHPEFRGDDEGARRNREAAKLRLTEYAEKLAQFPQNLPLRVIAPLEIATAAASNKVVGYGMRLIEEAFPLRSLTQRSFRHKAGLGAGPLLEIFCDLHRTVSELHQRGVVIGDFNYLNVLFRKLEAYLIDSDSMQFGRFMCRSFTTRFVDPLICDAAKSAPLQIRPHSSNSDWYAYALMLFEALLYVHPYGGVYEPKNPAEQLPPDARPLKRISVFSPEVVYPVKAAPLSSLPSLVANYYGELLLHDRRGPFPLNLLEILKAQAAGRYLDPAKQTAAVRKLETIRGKVRAKRYFQIAGGSIVAAALQHGKLRLLCHKGNQFSREDGSGILSGALGPGLKFRLSSNRTLIAFARQLAVFSPGAAPLQHPVDQFQGKRAAFDANARHYYWLSGGQLFRDDSLGPKFIGNTLQNQTLFWVGPNFGFGFYRVSGAGAANGFVFDAEKSGINDSVKLPGLRGELLDAVCYFSSRRAWFLTATQEGAQVLHRCAVIGPDGAVLATAGAQEGDGSWLGELRGKCAVTLQDASGKAVQRLFAATSRGLLGINEENGAIVEAASYPDTKGFVHEDDRLFFDGSAGLYVVGDNQVQLLTF